MKFSLGATLLRDGTHFRVYASNAKEVDVVLMDNPAEPHYFALTPEGNGYFAGFFAEFKNLSRYGFRLDGGPCYPDPTSHFQPDGPFAPSQVIDQQTFKWSDQNWQGKAIEGQIIYEMHIGTFTPEGTYAAAEKQLPELVKLGITTLEIMPLNEFPGKFGWGYDGVNLFAPTRLYGSPNQLKAFINAAHRLHLGVILDVVYNHFGPAGNFLSNFSADYFAEKEIEWGRSIDFTKKSTREFFLSNIRYWLEVFHFDGFRFDALDHVDYKNTSILTDIKKIALKAGKKRCITLVGENEAQDSKKNK